MINVPEKFHQTIIDLFKWEDRSFPVPYTKDNSLSDFDNQFNDGINQINNLNLGKPCTLLMVLVNPLDHEKNKELLSKFIEFIRNNNFYYKMYRSSGGGICIYVSKRKDFVDFGGWFIENVHNPLDKDYLQGFLLGYPLNKIYMSENGAPEFLNKILNIYGLNLPDGIVQDSYINRRRFKVVEDEHDANYPKDPDHRNIYSHYVTTVIKIAHYINNKWF